MLHLVNHPLITMKLNKMRDEKTNSKDFRTLLDEISSLMTYEVFKDVNLVSSGRKIKTPTGCEIDKLKLEHDIIIVPILRAGMGMSNGVVNMLPTARIGHIGLYRDETTLKPVEYKAELNEAISTVEEAINKIELDQELAGYKWIPEEQNIDTNELNVFNLDAEKEIENAIKESETGKINLYKMNFAKGVKAVAFSNCVYYDNQNKTLPEGMDLSTSVLIDCNRLEFNLIGKNKFRTNNYFVEQNNLIQPKSKDVFVYEYDVTLKEDKEKTEIEEVEKIETEN